MAPSQKPTADSRSHEHRAPEASNSDLAQTYRDLVRGEQAAAALEANLSNLESKLDAMLAAFEDNPPTKKGGEVDDEVPNDGKPMQDGKATNDADKDTTA